MIVLRCLAWVGLGSLIIVFGLLIAVVVVLLMTGTIVLAAAAPAVARVDCATAAVIIGRALDYAPEQRKELMRRYRVTRQDIRAIVDRCNIKVEPPR